MLEVMLGYRVAFDRTELVGYMYGWLVSLIGSDFSTGIG
jgi:hypothetical protein